MNNGVWYEAMNMIDRKYIDRAVESYRDGNVQNNVTKVVFSSKTTANPKKNSAAASVMFSFAAIAVLVIGLYLIFEYAVKNRVNVDAADNTSVTTVESVVKTIIEDDDTIIESDNRTEIDFSISDNNIGTTMEKSPNAYVGAVTNGDFYVVNPDNLFITKFFTEKTNIERYEAMLPEDTEPSDYRFLFNGDRPIALKKELTDDGDYSFYVLSFDNNLTNAKKKELSIPDNFFDFENARISSDGKYLIDIHFNIHFNRESYIRVYSLDNYGLYAEINNLEKYIGEFSIDEVIEAVISPDGSKLLIITEGMSAYNDYLSDESMIICASVIDIESGIVYISTALFNAEEKNKTLQYNDGIAVFTEKFLYLCGEYGVQSCSFPDELTDIKLCSISANGRYIVAVTNDDNVYEYEIVADDAGGFSLIACENESMYFGEIGAICVNDSGIICINELSKQGPVISYNVLY